MRHQKKPYSITGPSADNASFHQALPFLELSIEHALGHHYPSAILNHALSAIVLIVFWPMFIWM